MKKNILLGIAIFSVFLVTSCKSTDVENEVDERAGKSYVGWVDSTGKDVVYKDGLVQVKVKQNLGTINLGVVNENEKVIPVLNTADEFTSTAFYLKTLKKTYTLRKDSNIRTAATRKKSGVSINYYLEKAFDVTVDFETLASGEFGANDMLKVTYTLKNLGAKKDEFSLKAIFDTVLGESDSYHFYTSENLPVKSEVCYRTMQNQKWFVSKNKNAAMQFIFNGADTTAPELVALANYSTFQKNGWEPEMTSYRAFDTVLSYNNSAVGVIWPAAKLKPNGTCKYVFYIAVAPDGEEPAGHKFIFAEEPEKAEAVPEKVVVSAEKTNTVAEPVPAEIPAAVTAPVAAPVPVAEPEPAVAEELLDLEPIAETPVEPEPVAEEETVNGLTKKQLSPEYIQNLIDRITELEQDTSKINSEELQALNTELDEILSALR